MRRAILVILAAIVGIVALFLIVVALQPSEYHVTRTTTIDAAPAVVFAHVNDFHKWDDWSPWAKLDPDVKATYQGPDDGEGAVFRWAGNDKVGEGSMTIVESKPHERIDIELEFIKPMEGKADVDFQFEPQGDQTVVTWGMHGKNDFVGKAFCLFMDMDAMIGGDYEQGLANLKRAVEEAEEAEAKIGGASDSQGDSSKTSDAAGGKVNTEKSNGDDT
jgi:hypothetical protein